MKIFLFLSDALIPLTMFYIIINAGFRGIDVYESFLSGVKEGFRIVIGIAPTLIALMISVGIFRSSGTLDLLCSIFRGPARLIRIPRDLIPVFVVRIFSSSAATGLVLDLFKEYGPDSRTGMTASIMMSCTETVIYTVTVYYMSIRVKKTRWTIPGAIAASLAGAAASVLIVGVMT